MASTAHRELILPHQLTLFLKVNLPSAGQGAIIGAWCFGLPPLPSRHLPSWRTHIAALEGIHGEQVIAMAQLEAHQALGSLQGTHLLSSAPTGPRQLL